MSTSPTPETDACIVLARANSIALPRENTEIRPVPAGFARKLERERNQLQRWKEEMLFVWKKWDEVDAAVRKHPDAVVGHNVSDTMLRFIKERDELSWISVTERRPTEEDANEYGDVDWSDGKDIWKSSFEDANEDKAATHWRRIVLP
jgi:hypothetical protein